MTFSFSPFAMSRFVLYCLGLTLAAVLSACGGGGGGAGQVGLPTGTALYTTAPATVNLAAPGKLDYTIGGGTPTYQAASSNKEVATVSVSGSGLVITGVGAGSATITVTDAVGATSNIAVAVTGSAVVTSAPLFTTAGGALNVGVGAAATYTIGGGKPGYAVSSSNTSAAKVTVSGTSFTITGVGAGSADIVVTDSTGSALTLAVTVGSATGTPATLFTTAPSAVTVPVGATAAFSVGGGKPAYSVTSSNASVAKVATNGGDFIVTGVAPGTAQIVIVDTAGASISIAVTVGVSSTDTALFVTAASDIDLNVGEAAAFAIGGGKAPYTASSSKNSVVTASVSGGTLTINGVAPGAATVLVADSVGATRSITVTVGAGSTSGTLFTTAAGAVTVAVGANSTFGIGGGKAAYAVSSSNAAVASVTLSGNNFTVTGVSAGTADVIVTDSTGAALTIAVSVGPGAAATPALFTTAPSTVTVAVGATAGFSVGGGKPAYSISSSNTSVATVSSSGTSFIITGVAQGSAQIVLVDAAGATIAVGVTVGATSTETALFVTAANDIDLAVSETATFSIGGGKGPYSASSSKSAVASVTSTASSVSITGVAPGVATVVVADSVGATRSINVTVGAGTPPVTPADLAVQPASATGNVGDTLTFQVNGGTPGYSIVMNNTAIATVAPANVAASGGSFTVNLVNVGSTSATITDSLGRTTILPIDVAQTTTTLRLSPSALLVGESFLGQIDLNIFGGTGPYRVFTSDLNLSDVSIVGSTMTVKVGKNLNRCIDPKDSGGAYVPFGTFDVTLTAVDSLGASATSIMTIKDNGEGVGASCP